MDELSQLDELIESDILEALSGDGSTAKNTNDTIINNQEEIHLENIEDDNIKLESVNDASISNQEETIESNLTNKIKDVNSSDLAVLLSQLLNNKTIEITIKIKD